MANPFPFTAGQILTAAQINSIGETSTAYTPTITNFTLGNGTLSFAFTQVNKLVFVRGTITFGSTTAFTGTPSFTFPRTAASFYGSQSYFGNVYILDSGTAAFSGMCVALSATAFEMSATLVNGTYASQNAFNATTPMTWTTNDTIRVSFVYEAA
jgi:hypothetical protein